MRDVRSLTEAELLEFVKCWREDSAGITAQLGLSANDASRLAKFLGIKKRSLKPQRCVPEPEDSDDVDPEAGLTDEELERRAWLRGRYHRYRAAFRETKRIVAILVAEFNRKRQRPDRIAELQALQAESEARMRACGDMAMVVSELHATCPDVQSRLKFEMLYRQMRDFAAIELRREAAMLELSQLSERMIHYDGTTMQVVGNRSIERESRSDDLDGFDHLKPRTKCRGKRIGNDIRAAIIAMRRSGESVGQISEALGVSRSTICALTPTGRRSPLSEIEIGRMRELRMQGVSAEDIADQFGCHVATVWKQTKGAISKVTKDEILELYLTGASLRQVCRQLHLHRETVLEAIGDSRRHTLDRSRLTAGDALRARALLRRGHTRRTVVVQLAAGWKSIALKLGLSDEASRKIARGGDVPPLEKVLRVRADIVGGMSIDEVRQKYGVSPKVAAEISPIEIEYDAEERAEMVDGIREMIRKGYMEEEAAKEWRVSVDEVRKAIKPHWSEKHIYELWPAIWSLDMDEPPEPVAAPPGSALKIELMRRRWENEVCPHHRQDAREGDRVGHDILFALGLA